MKTFARLSKALEQFLSASSIFIILALLIMTFGEVISRYIFLKSHNFVAETSGWALVWVTYLTIGLNLKYNRDMNVDFLPTRLNEKYKNLLFIVFDVVTIFFAVLLCWAGVRYIEIMAQIGIKSISFPSLSTWVIRLCVVIGSILLAFFSIEHLIVAIHSLKKPAGGAK